MDILPDNAPRARLDIVSDVVCPWCYIGKQRLARALALLGDDLVPSVRWRPFELNPDLPASGMDRRAYCEAKFGSVERARALYAQVAAHAEAEGLPLAIERVTRTPNTRRAHVLIELARAQDCQDRVVDALFAAYFVEGRDRGATDTLVEIGAAAGIPAPRISAALADPDQLAAVAQAEATAHAHGVSGVPAFFYNDRLLFSGAQSPETIAATLRRMRARGL